VNPFNIITGGALGGGPLALIGGGFVEYIEPLAEWRNDRYGYDKAEQRRLMIKREDDMLAEAVIAMFLEVLDR